MPGRVLVVEDERGMQIALQDRLTSEGYEVAVEGNGIRGEDRAKAEDFNIIILDVMLPARDGFQICQNLRAESVQTPILMLTARNTTIDTVMGLRIGADDYLAKPFEMQILVARVEALLRRTQVPKRSKLPNGSRYRFGSFILDTNARQLLSGGDEVDLSAQEYRLLSFLVEHAGRTIDRDELLNEVWGYDTETTTRTVDVHVSWLRQKLEEQENPVHLITVRGYGYKFVTG